MPVNLCFAANVFLKLTMLFANHEIIVLIGEA